MFNINSIQELKNISEQMKWQYFEKLVAFIFSQNKFSVKQNKVITFEHTKRQYDVIAKHYDKTIIAECKKWKGGRYKKTQLKKETTKHNQRCELYSQKFNKKVTPLIVTLKQENINKYDNTLIVPLLKLNTFINKIHVHY